MKLFMCVNYPVYNPAIGISKKILSQIENFEELGFEVTFSAYKEKSIVICDKEGVKKEYRYNMPLKIFMLFKIFLLMNVVGTYLKDSDEIYDAGFIRWEATDYFFFKALKQLKKKCRVVIMDCHGYHPNYKATTLKSFYIEKTNDLFNMKLNKYIDICLTETHNTTLFGIPSIPMDTGIDIDKYSIHKYIGKSDELHMISVLNELSYHGLDRVIKGMSLYRDEKVFLHLVGNISLKTKKLVHNMGLDRQVIFYGYKSGYELENIYNKCNIGVGPLAPHRSGGKEGTGIKTKEYFAIGLPYFYAGQELIVPDNYPYILRFESNEDPIDIKRIIEFYNGIKEDISIQEKMRLFAKDNFCWKTIFSKAFHELGFGEF